MSCSGAGACVDILYVAKLSSPGLMNVLCCTPFPVDFLFVNPNDANDFVQCNHVGLDTTTIPTPLLSGNFLDPSTVSEELISWVLSMTARWSLSITTLFQGHVCPLLKSFKMILFNCLPCRDKFIDVSIFSLGLNM